MDDSPGSVLGFRGRLDFTEGIPFGEDGAMRQNRGLSPSLVQILLLVQYGESTDHNFHIRP
jgi:hypothetical protein